MITKRPRPTLPGDELATMEEFNAGEGTYTNLGAIRAIKLGWARYDFKKREASVEGQRQPTGVPRPGASIIGQIESIGGNVINVRVYYVGDVKSSGRFTGMLLLKPEGGRGRARSRGPIVGKPGDILRARVTSNRNAIIHLSIDGEEDGVIYTICSICGGRVIRAGRRVKCVECGIIDERRLASDFGQAPLR